MIKPVLLTYTKTVRKRYIQIDYQVTGNVLLLLNDDVVDNFGIPTVANIDPLIEQKIKECSYQRVDGLLVKRPEGSRISRRIESGSRIARLYQRLATGNYAVKNYGVRFPYFFNSWMINLAIGSMVQPTSKWIEFAIDGEGGRHTLLPGTPRMNARWGESRLAQSIGPSKNTDKAS